MFDRSICRRKPMFLMSWTSTRSSADRRRCGDSAGLSLMTLSAPRLLPAAAQEMHLHGDSGAQRGLRGITADLHDDLEGAACRIDRRADELDRAGSFRLGEVVGDDLDLVAPLDLQKVLLLDIDPGQERLGCGDLEERLVGVVDDLLADPGVLLGDDAGERRADDGVLSYGLRLLPIRDGDR